MRFLHNSLIILLFASQAIAQAPDGYHWEEERGPYALSDSEKNEPVLQLLQHVQHEYTYENNDLMLYYTLHEIIRVNNDEAIAQHNRIYIPVQSAIELTEIHARTVQPDGSIMELDRNNIKEVEDQEEGQGYTIFAIEGAKIGSEIEYYYTIKRTPKYFGREYFQGRVPVKEAHFKLTSPKNLQFEFKSYNGFAELAQTEDEERNIYAGETTAIPALKKEEYASFNQNRQRLEFRLSYNTATSRARLLTWEDVGKRIYNQTYTLENKEQKDLEKWLDDLKISSLSPEEKIASIEDGIKKNFYIDETGSSSDIFGDIIKQKVGTKFGLFRFMSNALKTSGIVSEIVMTSDRSDLLFDGSFESYNYLVDYLIYIPEGNLFIAPYQPQYRAGLTPPEFTANQGLFISSKVVRDVVFPVTEVREIPAHSYKTNFDNLQVNVVFNESLTANDITIERSFTGYTSSYVKAILPLMEEKDKEEMISNFIKFVSPDADFKQKKFVKAETEWSTWKNPLVVNGELTSAHFIENAGNTILFKAGELIGPQSELYQETERKMGVMNEYNRGYLREIIVTLPEGFKVQNIDDLTIDEYTVNSSGERIFTFTSAYELNNNVLKITIDEYYNQIYYPADKFEDFRKVINAAADFNKVVLVLKK
jgi:hypothetical protein